MMFCLAESGDVGMSCTYPKGDPR